MYHLTRMVVRATILISFVFSSFVYSASIVRGPYINMVNDSEATIRWRTDVATNSEVKFGLNSSNLNQSQVVSGSRTEHEVRVTGLSAHTLYYYSVGSTSEVIAGDTSYRFQTSPTPGSSVDTRIWLIGDSGTANSNAAAVYNAYMNYSGSDSTDLWIMLGDNAYNSGTDSEYQDAVFDMYPELLRRTPLWSTLGNHDGYTADSDTESGPYYDIFTFPRNAEVGGLASGTEAYYSFDYGDIHFICLDSYETNRSSGGAMMTWLENDLAANDKKWVIAYWHHPPYTKGSHNSDSEGALIDMRENALPILESYGVDLVFSGHSHSYERSYLINGHYGSSGSFSSNHLIDGGDGKEDGNGAYQKVEQSTNSGAVYTVAGASGKISGGSLNHPAMYTSLNQLGSVIVDINGNRLDVKHLRSTGQVSDYYTIIKGDDNTAPMISSVSATSSNQVNITFNEKVDPTTAANTGNYSIDNGIQVLNATVNGAQVLLTTNQLTIGTNYTLTVNNVQDTNGNPIQANSQASFNYQNIQTVSLQNGVSPSANYQGGEDTYIASGRSSTNYGNDSEILADGSDGSNGELATLLKWDLSSIPSGATVSEASIELEVFNPSSGSYSLYLNGQSWSESGATWNSIDPNNTRGSLVASFSPSSSGNYKLTLNSSGLTALQSWINGTSNTGFVLMTGGTSDGIDMRSSEYSSAAVRPKLSITYSVNDGGSNQAPNADFSFTTNDLTASFNDGSNDSDGTIVSWSWNFGDGNSSSQQSPSHSYSAAGSYSVSLTVTDNEGATNTKTKTVNVSNTTGPVTVEFQNGLNSYSGNQDTYVAEGRASTNYGNDTEILSDRDDGSRDELITLLKWDVSSIPTGATVTSAILTLQVHNRTSNVYNFWSMLQSWSESTATWNNTLPESNRGVKVANFTPSSTGEYQIVLNASGIALVQSWINGAANNGVTIESGGTRNGIDMRSSEYSSQSQRPKLTITYE